ncbi:hypothetical protein FJ366_01390 [Candidatus Dependentiae bacterium]|nr:hypothetical protein [Candidatus Dependentiae bacterium]
MFKRFLFFILLFPLSIFSKDLVLSGNCRFPSSETVSMVNVFYEKVESQEQLHDTNTVVSFIAEADIKELAAFIECKDHQKVVSSSSRGMMLLKNIIKTRCLEAKYQKTDSFMAIKIEFLEPQKTVSAQLEFSIKDGKKLCNVTIRGFSDGAPKELVNFFYAALLDGSVNFKFLKNVGALFALGGGFICSWWGLYLLLVGACFFVTKYIKNGNIKKSTILLQGHFNLWSMPISP